MTYWQTYIKPCYTGSADSDDFDDAGYFIPVPGLPDLPEIGHRGGLLYMEKYSCCLNAFTVP